ncbi:MAG: hypothetical protein GC137_08270 [Alphaproteobacteria bacterium]|nr:hypothetical protein [Alphaproteobacteria bacterium]
MSIKDKTESGTVLLYILLAVALLAALSYAVANTTRGSVQDLTDDRANILAVEIIEYANILTQAVTQVKLRGYSDREISFENTNAAGYINANCTEDECKIFHVDGGGLTLLEPPPNANDGTDWLFAADQVLDIGTTDSDLVAILRNLDQTVCEQINRRLHGTTTIQPEDGTANNTQFTGTYGSGTELSISGLPGLSAYCFEGDGTFASGTYNYYHVLIPR